MIWLAKLLTGISDGSITDGSLEVCDRAMIFKLLISPHGREGQGLLAAAWKLAKVNFDSCQCTLMLATEHLKLNLLATNISQQDLQNISGVDSHGPLWGLQDWNKGEVCAEMAKFPSTTPPVFVNLEETLCIKQWSKTKSLTFNRLDIFLGGGQKYS